MQDYYNKIAYDKKRFFPGSTGVDSVIIAYDCLLDSKNLRVQSHRYINNYDKIVWYACLNSGDSDTIGSIASAWYGAINNFGNASLNFKLDLEKDKEIKKISKNLEKLYT